MIESSQYELIDFGQNEKLESFSGTLVRRETPSATGNRGGSELWNSHDLSGKFVGDSFQWKGDAPDPWELVIGTSRLGLRQTPTGQIGVFPEQAVNWEWISTCPLDLKGLNALNLFAYTGATTMALAARGAQVVHVDAAKSVVNWARQNAKASGLEQTPIRWIVEDALTFVERENKRGNKYDIVVADPPSFGRGPKGETWKIQKDLAALLEGLAQLTAGHCKMALISCHTPGFGHRELNAQAVESFKFEAGVAESFEMSILASTGRRLPSGSCFRWFSQSWIIN